MVITNQQRFNLSFTLYKNKGNDLEWYAFNQKELEQFLLEKYRYRDELTSDLQNNNLIIIKGSKELDFKLNLN